MEFRSELAVGYHANRGHPDRLQTYDPVADRGKWPGMRAAIPEAMSK